MTGTRQKRWRRGRRDCKETDHDSAEGLGCVAAARGEIQPVSARPDAVSPSAGRVFRPSNCPRDDLQAVMYRPELSLNEPWLASGTRLDSARFPFTIEARGTVPKLVPSGGGFPAERFFF